MDYIRTRLTIDYFRNNNSNTRVVTKLGSDEEYVFAAKSGYEALMKMIYTLNIPGKCDPQIEIGPSGRVLYLEHNGDVYATING